MSKTIGILGGMGPLATADLFRKITCLTKASCDNDHIRVYIDSNARIPDRTAAILSGGTNPVPEMTSALRHLEACGADCIIMPCNTAHYFLPQLQAKTETPFLSMLAATAKTCAAKFPGKTAAILGTKGTLATGLYDRALEAVRMIVREPSLSYDVVTCVTGAMVPQLEAFRDMLLSEGVRHWRLFSIFPMGRAKNDPTLRMTDAQFREMLEFIRRTRQEGRIEVSYACEGFLGGYEAEVRDHFYQCAAGVSVASIRVDGAISGCTSIRANYHQGNIYRDQFWDVWQNRFGPFRDREWARRGECADCRMFRYCQGGGMHLRGDDGELLYCHYHRL